jgi:hypothetical protein
MKINGVEELFRILSSLPPPKGPKPLVPNESLGVVRCACGEPKPISMFSPARSKHIAYIDNVCEGCKNNFKDLATIVCCSCKRVVARLAPHKDPKGFRFEKGGIYHTDTCGGTCAYGKEDKELKEGVVHHVSVILEQWIAHQKIDGKPYDAAALFKFKQSFKENQNGSDIQ